MEMDLTKLDVDSLPDMEKAFLGGVSQARAVLYSVGYAAEQALRALMAASYPQLAEFENLALLRTGSGGRYDGAGLGEGDLILLTVDREGSRTYPLSELPRLLGTLRTPIIVAGMTWTPIDVEHKDLDGPLGLSAYAGDVNRLYPDRILEAEFLAGNPSLWDEARRRVLAEVRAEAGILAAVRKRQRVHENICRTGTQRFQGETLRHFDAQTGDVFYDPPGKVFGLKQCFMRYVQNALTIEILEFANRRAVPIDEIADLNQGVEERIRYVLRKGWVRDDDRAWQLIEYGIGYIKACDLNSKLKARYHTDGCTSVRIDPKALGTMYDLFVGEAKKGFLAP